MSCCRLDNSDGTDSLRELLGELDVSLEGSSDENFDVLIGKDTWFGDSMGVWTSRHSLYDVSSILLSSLQCR